MIVFVLCVFGYFLGFLSNLFKALDSKPFIVPQADIASAYRGLTDWEHLRYALAAVGVILLVVLFFVVKSKIESRNRDDRNFDVSEKGTYGTAKYLSERQAKKLVTADKEHSLLSVSKDLKQDDNGIILGKFPNGKLVMKRAIPKENMNVFVCGAPGSGKSYMFVRPYLAQCIRRQESFVCTDPSGELLETMGGYAKACGYKVKVFNLVDPEKSDSWNVTGEVGINQLHAQIAVSTIIKNTLEGERPDPFWDNGEKNLLKALLLYINSDAYTGSKSLGELYKLLASDDFSSSTLECLKNLDERHPAKLSYNIYAQATESVQQSFASGLATRLQIFQSEAIRNMTAFDDIDLTAPGKEKCAYFVVMSDQDSTYQLLSSLFFSFLFIKLADFGKTCKGQSLPVSVNMVLDELPSIGNIPDLGRKLATVRKYGVNVVPIIQLISQLDNRYSPAERSGTMTVDVSSKSEKVDFLPQTQLTSSVGKRAVLTVDEVLRLPLDEAVIVLRGQNILKLKKYRFHDHPDFKSVKAAKPITISDYVPEMSAFYEHTEGQASYIPPFTPTYVDEEIPYETAPEPESEQAQQKRPRRKSTGLKIN